MVQLLNLRRRHTRVLRVALARLGLWPARRGVAASAESRRDCRPGRDATNLWKVVLKRFFRVFFFRAPFCTAFCAACALAFGSAFLASAAWANETSALEQRATQTQQSRRAPFLGAMAGGEPRESLVSGGSDGSRETPADQPGKHRRVEQKLPFGSCKTAAAPSAGLARQNCTPCALSIGQA